MKISTTIAVTVHNREKYIEQCLDSLLAQTVKDIEVVCVDDASTDRSFEILLRYAENDNRVRVFRFDTNKGVQEARNRAMEMAGGVYIIYVDDDDWLSDDCVENCLRSFREHPEADCVLIPEIRQSPEGILYTPQGRKEFDVITGEEAFMLSMPWQVAGNFCVRLEYQRRFPYDNSCRYFGDENTGRMMLLGARHVVLSSGMYYYRMHNESVCHAPGIGHYSRLYSQRKLAGYIAGANVNGDIQAAYETFCWENIVAAYMRYCGERKDMPADMCREATGFIRRAFHDARPMSVDKRLKNKFGFMPMNGVWALFRLQEEVYYILRRLKAALLPVGNG